MHKKPKKYSVFSLIKNSLTYHENWQPAWRSPEPKKEYDAIIVGENVFRRRIKFGEDNYTSTIKGTLEVLTPVFFGVLTTIVVFAPMLDLAGETGDIWRTFPLTAIPILVFSLIESNNITFTFESCW